MNSENKNNNPVKKGSFIVFEGIDGSGKTTQIRLLNERLKKEGKYCYITMEPTDSPIGSLIHQIMTGRIKSDNKVIAALFVADRLDHILNDVNGIIHKINEGTTVVSDRYYFSSYAYHSIDMPMDWVIQANEESRKLLKPTITFFLDTSPDVAIERIAKNRFHHELFEKKSRLIQVREKYIESFERLKDIERFVIINGNRPEQQISEDIWAEIKKVI